jgi:hypothetical protein
MYARSLRYPACNAHAPYFHPWPVRLYKIFPFYLIKGTILEKKFTEQKTYFDFLYNFRLKHFSFQEELRETDQKVYWSPRKVPIILVRFY